MLHRPGPELQRLTPRNSADLLFDGLPWVARAQEEHDGFAQALRDRGVEVLYLTELLVQTLDLPEAREAVVQSAVSPTVVGPSLASVPAGLAAGPAQRGPRRRAGCRTDPCRAALARPGRCGGPAGRARRVRRTPLPNLLFTRDSSVWVDDHVAITSPSMHARQRERALTGAIYRHHPRFAGHPLLYGGDREEAWFEGGDVLVMAPGVLAVGTGQRTTPAGVEAFALRAFAAGIAHTGAGRADRPGAGDDAPGHHLHDGRPRRRRDVPGGGRHAVGLHGDGARRDGPAGERPGAVPGGRRGRMDIDKLRTIHTGLDPVTAEREQWDDGNNTLAIAPGLVVAYERNTETNERLEAAGIEVVPIAGSELGSGRGGPRCMSCPVGADPLPDSAPISSG
jgi:arginine deiminase